MKLLIYLLLSLVILSTIQINKDGNVITIQIGDKIYKYMETKIGEPWYCNNDCTHNLLEAEAQGTP